MTHIVNNSGQLILADVAALRSHLALTDDAATEDGTLLEAKLLAAQNYIELLVGYSLETMVEENSGQLPFPLQEAILQLAAFWYEHREAATSEGRARELPFGVREIVNEYREFTF